MLKSSIVTSGSTMSSRVLGMIRETVFAAVFGADAAADVFFLAFRIPNFLRRLFAEGAFAQAFVPVLSEKRKTESPEQVKQFIDRVAASLGAALLITTVLGVIGAPLLATLFAWGFMDDPSKFGLLVDMLRITFPYLILISLTGFAGAILNSYGHFAVPALTPVILNVVLILTAWLLAPFFAEPAIALAWGVLLAGALQLMFQLPFLAHLRMLPRPRLDLQDAGVRKVLGLMLPVMFSVSVGQINLMIDTALATSIEGDGSVSWLNYTDRLVELPLGIFATAIATVILPALSRLKTSGDAAAFSHTVEWGLRCCLLVGMPACFALLILAEPMVITLYQRGAFGVEDVLPTARSVRALGAGLLAFMAVKILASAYFSRQDTQTPVRCGVIAMVSNIVINLILIVPMKHVGLALSTAIAAFINAGLLLRGLLQRKVLVFAPEFWSVLVRLVLANLIMVVVLLLLQQPAQLWLQWDDLSRVLHLLLHCLVGGLVYLGALWLCGMRPRHFRA
ncbi:MAG: murein biosynthesis integral membrane protein MurJ [Pseudomonadota bacterium]